MYVPSAPSRWLKSFQWDSDWMVGGSRKGFGQTGVNFKSFVSGFIMFNYFIELMFLDVDGLQGMPRFTN